VSILTIDDAKIKLTMQYRVPHDIADLLNDRIYMCDYCTSPDCKAPEKGFHFIHVATPSYRTVTKYVNEDEIEYIVELVRQHKCKGYASIMILTPVSLIVS
jgi:superfamily I DNA and/or RNA helicase